MKTYLFKTLAALFLLNGLSIYAFSQNSTPAWYIQIGGELNEKPGKIICDYDSSIYFSATFQDSVQVLLDGTQLFNTYYSEGSSDIIFGKIQNDGTPLWLNQIGGKGIDLAPDMIIDRLGNSYIAGTFQYTSYFNSDSLVALDFIDAFVAKYDSSGTIQWITPFSGQKNNQISGISLGLFGNIFVSGFFNGTNTIANDAQSTLISIGGFDSFVAKLNTNGDHIWTQGIHSKNDVFVRDLAVDFTNNCYFTGSYSDTLIIADTIVYCPQDGQSDVIIGRLSPFGGLKWLNTFGGQGNDIGKDISFKNIFRIVVSGEYSNDLYLNGTNLLSSVGANDIYRIIINRQGDFIRANSSGQKRNDFIYENNRTINHRFLKVTDIKLTDSSFIQNLLFNKRLTLSSSDTGEIFTENMVVSEGLKPRIRSATMDRDRNYYYLASFSDTYSSLPLTFTSKGLDDLLIVAVSEVIDTLKSIQFPVLDSINQNQLDFTDIDFSDSIEYTPIVKCYPNPFSSFTDLYYRVFEKSSVNIRVYDLAGNLLSEEVFFNIKPGEYSYKIDHISKQPGIFPCFISIEGVCNNYTEVIKLVLTR